MKKDDSTPASDNGEEKNERVKTFEVDEANIASTAENTTNEHVETTNNLEGSDGLDDDDPSLYEDELRDK